MNIGAMKNNLKAEVNKIQDARRLTSVLKTSMSEAIKITEVKEFKL